MSIYSTTILVAKIDMKVNSRALFVPTPTLRRRLPGNLRAPLWRHALGPRGTALLA